MSAASLIQQITNDGLRLPVTPDGKIKAAGDHAAISHRLLVLQILKAENIDALAEADFQEVFQERAAILEYDAGLSREKAEQRA